MSSQAKEEGGKDGEREPEPSESSGVHEAAAQHSRPGRAEQKQRKVRRFVV